MDELMQIYKKKETMEVTSSKQFLQLRSDKTMYGTSRYYRLISLYDEIMRRT
jgi:hypothetical protein